MTPLLLLMVVPRRVLGGPTGRWCWSLLKCCQGTANAAASHFGWREGDLALLSCCWPWTTPLAGPRGGIAIGRDEFTSFEEFCWWSTDGQQIFYTSVLWYCSSSYCNLSSAAIWQQAWQGSVLPGAQRKGVSLMTISRSLTGAHCYASVRRHVQAACKESCHAMLRWAIPAWTKSTVTVSRDDSARKRAEDWKSLENYSLQAKYRSYAGTS